MGEVKGVSMHNTHLFGLEIRDRGGGGGRNVANSGPPSYIILHLCRFGVRGGGV